MGKKPFVLLLPLITLFVPSLFSFINSINEGGTVWKTITLGAGTTIFGLLIAVLLYSYRKRQKEEQETGSNSPDSPKQ